MGHQSHKVKVYVTLFCKKSGVSLSVFFVSVLLSLSRSVFFYYSSPPLCFVRLRWTFYVPFKTFLRPNNELAYNQFLTDILKNERWGEGKDGDLFSFLQKCSNMTFQSAHHITFIHFLSTQCSMPHYRALHVLFTSERTRPTTCELQSQSYTSCTTCFYFHFLPFFFCKRSGLKRSPCCVTLIQTLNVKLLTSLVFSQFYLYIYYWNIVLKRGHLELN